MKKSKTEMAYGCLLRISSRYSKMSDTTSLIGSHHAKKVRGLTFSKEVSSKKCNFFHCVKTTAITMARGNCSSQMDGRTCYSPRLAPPPPPPPLLPISLDNKKINILLAPEFAVMQWRHIIDTPNLHLKLGKWPRQYGTTGSPDNGCKCVERKCIFYLSPK